eukprot:3804571-Alexandrium_andersonii.AAC.1
MGAIRNARLDGAKWATRLRCAHVRRSDARLSCRQAYRIRQPVEVVCACTGAVRYVRLGGAKQTDCLMRTQACIAPACVCVLQTACRRGVGQTCYRR